MIFQPLRYVKLSLQVENILTKVLKLAKLLIGLDINESFDSDQLELENKEIEQFYILAKLWKEDSNLTRSERQS